MKFNTIIKRFLVKIGLDKSIAYTSGARIIQGVGGIGSIFFISTFLSGIEQGYYYTFASILALQVFFELGLTGIMTQYVAHEASFLELDKNKIFQGDIIYKSRLASLLNFCLKWYSILGLIVICFLVLAGTYYFTRYGDTQDATVDWWLPWILICLGTGLKLFQAPLTSIFNGLGFVKDMSKITFYQQLVIPISTLIGLAIGLKLYVTGIGYLISVLIWQVYVIRNGLYTILINLIRVKITESVSYIKEIFPFQWRIALSWISGYFIFQLFNPVLFATEGAIIAGQMGMTLQALNAIQSLPMSWLNTKIPLYSRLIAQKEYLQLDVIFGKTLKQMVSICVTLLVLFVVFLGILRESGFTFNGVIIADRFLDYAPLFLMIVPIIQLQFINSWATYLRCHKKEPFLIFSCVNGALCLLSTLTMGNMYGLYGITISYCVIQLLVCPWGYYIFKTYKQKWHE